MQVSRLVLAREVREQEEVLGQRQHDVEGRPVQANAFRRVAPAAVLRRTGPHCDATAVRDAIEGVRALGGLSVDDCRTGPLMRTHPALASGVASPRFGLHLPIRAAVVATVTTLSPARHGAGSKLSGDASKHTLLMFDRKAGHTMSSHAYETPVPRQP